MRKVIITAAVVGSRPTKEMNPAVPYTPKEIAESAVESYKAGASIVHIHVRDPKTGASEFNLEYFKEVKDRIQDKCSVLVNLSTSGQFDQIMKVGEEAIEYRLQPVTLKPDLCSLDLGSLNFQDRVFSNPPQFGRAGAKIMRNYGVKPEVEVFDVGHVYQALDFISEGLFEAPPYLQFCLGAKWGLGATPEDLMFAVKKIPDHVVWSAFGTGKGQLPVMTMSVLLGGHIRVGFEDNIYLMKGVLAKSNAQFVEMAVNLIQKLNHEAASPEDARQILNI